MRMKDLIAAGMVAAFVTPSLAAIARLFCLATVRSTIRNPMSFSKRSVTPSEG